MKIVHICLNGAFTDGYTYQENLLTKYHKKLGYEVTVITSLDIYDKGRITQAESENYVNSDGVHIIRLKRKGNKAYGYKFAKYPDLIQTLNEEHSDLLFIHGVQLLQLGEIASYLKSNPKIITYVDNHADFSNSGRNFISQNVLHKGIWRHCAHVINPYVKKFYGVLPARVDWLIDMYHLPKQKCELLVMGADDEEVNRVRKNNVRKQIRERFGINDSDFLIVTGGKIDSAKLQTLLLMEAVNQINNPSVKLIVFGSVEEAIKERLNSLCRGGLVQYIGWATATQSYDYFAAADVVCFPGRHSVFWEQCAGMGLPMICKRWDGTLHIDVGGNVIFIEHDDVLEISNIIKSIAFDEHKLESMRKEAQKGMAMFSYQEIAKRAIELVS